MTGWPTALLVVLVVGVNFVLWGGVGLVRWCDEALVPGWREIGRAHV